MSATARPPEVHRPTDACWPSHCSFHNVDEPGAGAYRICVECGHVYKTAAELQEAFMAEVALGLTVPPPEAPDAEEIWYCPLCAHDF